MTPSLQEWMTRNSALVAKWPSIEAEIFRMQATGRVSDSAVRAFIRQFSAEERVQILQLFQGVVDELRGFLLEGLES